MTNEKKELLKRAKEYERMLKKVALDIKENKQEIAEKIEKLNQKIKSAQKYAQEYASAEEVVEDVFDEMKEIFMKKMEENAENFPELEMFLDDSLFIRGPDKHITHSSSDGMTAWGEVKHKSKHIDKDYILGKLDKMSGKMIESFDSTKEHYYDDDWDDNYYDDYKKDVFKNKQTQKQKQRIKEIKNAREIVKLATEQKEKLEKELNQKGQKTKEKQNLKKELSRREENITEGMMMF